MARQPGSQANGWPSRGALMAAAIMVSLLSAGVGATISQIADRVAMAVDLTTAKNQAVTAQKLAEANRQEMGAFKSEISRELAGIRQSLGRIEGTIGSGQPEP